MGPFLSHERSACHGLLSCFSLSLTRFRPIFARQSRGAALPHPVVPGLSSFARLCRGAALPHPGPGLFSFSRPTEPGGGSLLLAVSAVFCRFYDYWLQLLLLVLHLLQSVIWAAVDHAMGEDSRRRTGPLRLSRIWSVKLN